MYFEETTQTASQLPAILVAILGSGVLGSLIALSGVYLQNHGNDRRHREQLAAQAAEKEKERTMALRRDIYIEGADALGRMQSYLLGFSNLNSSDEDHAKIVNGVVGSINKFAMIASLQEMRALDELQAFYATSSSALVMLRLEIRAEIEEITRRENVQKSLADSMQQVTAELNAANLKKDATGGTELIERSRSINTIFSRNEDELKNLRGQLLESILKINHAALEAVVRFDEVSLQLNCLLRAELGFPIDEADYRAILEAASERNRAATQERLREIDERFRETARNSILSS
jgi:hypothetical protein